MRRLAVRSLPLMGEGTRRRLAHTGAAGSVRAKTGTLDRVSALAG